MRLTKAFSYSELMRTIKLGPSIGVKILVVKEMLKRLKTGLRLLKTNKASKIMSKNKDLAALLCVGVMLTSRKWTML